MSWQSYPQAWRVVQADAATWDNLLIVGGYGVLAVLLLFVLAPQIHFCGLKRAKLGALGVANFAFGAGKFLTLFGLMISWLFKLGHFAFLAFGFLYVIAAVADRRETKRLRLRVAKLEDENARLKERAKNERS